MENLSAIEKCLDIYSPHQNGVKMSLSDAVGMNLSWLICSYQIVCKLTFLGLKYFLTNRITN